MPTPGRLASVLNGIVISTLGACGSTEGDVEGSAGAKSGTGGDAVMGTSNDSGSGGRVQTAGSDSGDSIVIGLGGNGGTGGTGTAGTGAGGYVSMVSMTLRDERGLLRYVDGLHLPEAVDYLGVYLNQGPGNNTLYQSTGTPCSDAGDKPACEAALAAGTPSSGFPYLVQLPPIVVSNLPSYTYMFLAYTRGNSVGFIVDREQLNAFLGEIDSANEAGLVFLSMGVGPACNGIWETPDAYYYSTPFTPIGCSMMPPGHYQAATAATAAEADARQLWQDIARDESDHAELSLALHDWFMLQLTTHEQALVEAAMQRARNDLRAELLCASAPHPAVTHQAGVPEPARAAVLFGELERQVLETVFSRAA